jgi:hypothetical protein
VLRDRTNWVSRNLADNRARFNLNLSNSNSNSPGSHKRNKHRSKALRLAHLPLAASKRQLKRRKHRQLRHN